MSRGQTEGNLSEKTKESYVTHSGRKVVVTVMMNSLLTCTIHLVQHWISNGQAFTPSVPQISCSLQRDSNSDHGRRKKVKCPFVSEEIKFQPPEINSK